MSQTRTEVFAAAAERPDAAPILLVRAALSGGTRYWTSRQGSYGGRPYLELLKAGISIGIGLDEFGRALRSLGRLTLANESDGTGSRASDMLATDIVANRGVEIDYLPAGLTHPTDSLRLFTGCLDVPTEDCFDDQELRLDLMDDGNPLWAGIQDLGAARIHRILGARITAAAYPSADPDAIGEVQPILYGSMEGSPCYPVDAGALDVLAADISAAATTITLSDDDAFALFPASGTVRIEDEEITYTGKGVRTLTGCTRGTGGTAAAAHVAGRQVWEIQASYVYLVAAHACKAVNAVYVDGRRIDPSAYSVSLVGPTTITFNAKQLRALATTVTTQPSFSASVTAEQGPGTISITAEQSPGSISTSAEHGHSTTVGTHTHTETYQVHEYPSPNCPWSSVSADKNFSFVTLPISGSTANWLVSVSTISGSWKIQNASLVDVATLSAGDNYITESNAVREYILKEVSAGTITITKIERDATAQQTTGSTAPSGSTSPTGATATSMASLSGSTAANMATLAGSTAVSLSQTQNVVVSAADIVVGQVVTADVDGYEDDGSGTYTGTPNALITNPSDQIRHLLAVQLGLTLGDWVDSASFAAARAAFASAGIRCDWGLYDQIDSAELLERIRWSVAARLYQSANGKFKLFALPLSGSSVLTLSEVDHVLDAASGGGPIRVGRSALSDLYNQVYVLHGKRLAVGDFAGYATAADATSQADYRMVRTLIIENDFVRDATAAQAIADAYLAWHKDQRWRATSPCLARPVLHVEPCDKVAVTAARMPGGWTAKTFWVERIQLELGRQGQADLAVLTLREA